MFIEARNAHMYSHKDENVFVIELNEFSKEKMTKLQTRFSQLIHPMTFPDNVIRSAYIDEPDWNDIFFVMETENSYFGVFWYTTA